MIVVHRQLVKQVSVFKIEVADLVSTGGRQLATFVIVVLLVSEGGAGPLLAFKFAGVEHLVVTAAHRLLLIVKVIDEVDGLITIEFIVSRRSWVSDFFIANLEKERQNHVAVSELNLELYLVLGVIGYLEDEDTLQEPILLEWSMIVVDQRHEFFTFACNLVFPDVHIFEGI